MWILSNAAKESKAIILALKREYWVFFWTSLCDYAIIKTILKLVPEVEWREAFGESLFALFGPAAESVCLEVKIRSEYIAESQKGAPDEDT